MICYYWHYSIQTKQTLHLFYAMSQFESLHRLISTQQKSKQMSSCLRPCQMSREIYTRSTWERANVPSSGGIQSFYRCQIKLQRSECGYSPTWSPLAARVWNRMQVNKASFEIPNEPFAILNIRVHICSAQLDVCVSVCVCILYGQININ